MIGETAWLRKKTCLPVVLEVNRAVRLNTKSIDMYIGHDSSVGVCFMKRSGGPHLLLFSPFPARWRVCHNYFLVLVFAASRRQLALRSGQARVGEQADAMLFFLYLHGSNHHICHNFA